MQSNHPLKITLNKGLFNFLSRELVISSDGLVVKKRINQSIQIKAGDITGYRFGVKWLRGVEFVFGREYQIFIERNNTRETKISFKSLYGYKRKEKAKIYSDILDALWEKVFDNVITDYLNRFDNHDTFEICDVEFNQEGLFIKVDKVLNSKKTFIAWEDVDTNDYQTYFVISSKSVPQKIYRGYSYLNDSNTGLLYSLTRTILKNKKYT